MFSPNIIGTLLFLGGEQNRTATYPLVPQLWAQTYQGSELAFVTVGITWQSLHVCLDVLISKMGVTMLPPYQDYHEANLR